MNYLANILRYHVVSGNISAAQLEEYRSADNPDLIVACVVGDGESETGALATGWHGNKFLNLVV